MAEDLVNQDRIEQKLLKKPSFLSRFLKPFNYWFLYSFLFPLGVLPGNFIRRMLLPFFLAKCGKRFWVYPNTYIHKPEFLFIGDYVNINYSAYINAAGGIEIGDYTGLGPFACIYSSLHNHPASNFWRHSGDTLAKVSIGRDCMIGANAVVLPGTILEDGCIVSPGSVVMGSFPKNAIIMGNPARLIKYREDS